MEVDSSKNPIIINGKDISNPTWYLSAEGVEVKSSKNPVIVNGKDISNPTWYMSADGYDFDGMDEVTMGDGQGRMAAPSSAGDDFYGADSETYSYIDKNNSSEVRAFQDWLDAQGIKWVGATNAARNNGRLLNKGSGYGTFGPSTTNAYAVYGAQWEATRTSVPPSPPASAPASAPATPPPPVPTEVVTTGVPVIPAGQQPTVAQIEQQRKRGVFWDKAKGTWIKAKESGVVSWLADFFGITPQPPATPVGGPTTEPRQRKMGTGATIAIAVGALVVIGLIVYSQKKKSA